MGKFNYVVGVFLTETDFVTHNIPEKTLLREEKLIGFELKGKSLRHKHHRKTEHTTKKRNRKEIIDN